MTAGDRLVVSRHVATLGPPLLLDPAQCGARDVGRCCRAGRDRRHRRADRAPREPSSDEPAEGSETSHDQRPP